MNTIICDFDGCLCKKNSSDIDVNIVNILLKLSIKYKIIFITARATMKSKNEALEALKKAGIGMFKIYFRNILIYDNSYEGIIRYKTDTIKNLINNGYHCIFGIGDELSDEVAYKNTQLNIIRFVWPNYSQTNLSNCPYIIEVKEENLGNAWKELNRYVEKFDKKQLSILRRYGL